MSNLELGLQIKLEGNELVVRQLDGTRSSVKGFGKDIDQSKRSTDDAVKANRDLATSYRTVKASIAALGIGFLVREYVSLTDQYNVLDQRVKTATRDTGDYVAISKELLKITQDNGIALASTVGVFQQFSRAKEALQATNDEVLLFTDTVQKLGVIGGSTTEDLKNGLRQLGQALNSPKVQAEEMNSILDQLPEVAKRIETGLSLLPGTLKQAVNEGRVLSKDIFEALLKQAPEIAEQFKEIPLSVDRATAQLTNSVSRALGLIDNETSAMQALAESISGVSKSLDEINPDTINTLVAGTKTLTSLIGVALVASLVKSGQAFAADTITKIKNYQAGRTVALTALDIAKAEHAASLAILQSHSAMRLGTISSAQYAAQQARVSVTARNLVVAQSAAKAATIGLSTAMRTIAGPVGLIALTAVAFIGFNRDADKTVGKLDELTTGTDEYSEALGKLTLKQAALQKLNYSKQVEELEEAVQLAKDVQKLATIGNFYMPGGDTEVGIRKAAEIETLELKLTQTRKKLADVTAIANGEEVKKTEVIKNSIGTTAQLEKAEKQLLDTLFPLEAQKKKINAQLVQLTALEQAGKVSTDDYTQAKAALEKQLHELNNPLESVIDNMASETQWLQKELTATVAGEQALRAFNRTKTIELELRRVNAEQLAPAEVDQLRAEIAARYDAATALDDYQAATEDAARAQEQSNATMERFITEIVGSFVDGAGSIGDAFKDLWNRIKREFINSGVASLFNFNGPSTPLLSGVSGLFSGGASASGGGSGGGFSVTELLSNGKSLLNLNGAINGVIDGVVNTMFNAGFQDAAVSIGNYTQSITGASGGIGGAAGGIGLSLAAGFAGNYVGKQLGSALFGKTANSNYGALAGGTIGSIFGPPGTLAGSTLGSMVDVALGGDGKERVSLGVLTEPGSQSPGHKAYGASGLELTAYAKRAGSEGTALADQLAEAAAYTDTVLTGLYEQLGTTVNLTGRTLDGKAAGAGTDWGKTFFGSAEFNGINQGDVESVLDDFTGAWQAKVKELTGFVADLSPFEPLMKEGEALADTIGRVQIEFVGVTGALDALGFELLDLSVGGMAAADNLVQAFGGLDQLSTGIAAYYDAFYTDGEKLEKLGDSLNQQFNALGVAMPKTREGFRQLVDGLDLTSAASQKLFADLINLAPSLNQYIAGQAQLITPAIAGPSLADLTTSILGRYDAEKAAIEDTQQTRIKALQAEGLVAKRIATSLTDTVSRLNLSDLSPLTNKARFEFAQSEYQRTLAAAQGGDLTAAGNLGSVGQAYLTEASKFFASSSDYTKIFNSTEASLASLGKQFSNQSDTSTEIAKIQTSTLRATTQLGSTALSQLREMVAMTAGIDSVAELLAVLPLELSGKLSAATGVDAADLSNDPIYELYSRGLNKTPDADGYAFWQNMLDSGKDYESLKELFFASALENGATEINRFNTGTPFVSHTQKAIIDYGEIIIDRESADALRKYGINVGTNSNNNDALLAEMKALRNEVASLRSERAADAQHASVQRNQQQSSIERTGRQAARSKVKVLS